MRARRNNSVALISETDREYELDSRATHFSRSTEFSRNENRTTYSSYKTDSSSMFDRYSSGVVFGGSSILEDLPFDKQISDDKTSYRKSLSGIVGIKGIKGILKEQQCNNSGNNDEERNGRTVNNSLDSAEFVTNPMK